MKQLFKVLSSVFILAATCRADSVNSPNITMNVDTNRSVGNGAGNAAVTVNTITIAETQLSEYSSGTGKGITVRVRPGYQFDTTSPITAQSATIGINGRAINVVANGSVEESITFDFTSGTNSTVQDIVRINGVKLKILSAVGAAGPAQNTMTLTTSAAGGAFTNQGIVAATITRGVADHLEFGRQPGNTEAGADLLPSVKIVDFGGNVIISDTRNISLSIETNPGSATLLGTTQVAASNGVATWSTDDDLNITSAASGYVLRATAGGSSLQTSSSVNSNAFTVSAGDPGSMTFLTQPSDTAAGDDIVLSVGLLDEFGNATVQSGIPISLTSAVNPGGWPLLVDSSTTKETVNGVASWTTDDNLRITKAVAGYQLAASGVGAPITTSSFAITAGAAAQVRFVEQPTDAKRATTIAPAVTAEIVDSFGNRTASTLSIGLSSSSSKCGALSGAEGVVTSAGLATFDALSLSKPCDDVQLLANVSGLVGAASEKFTIHATNAVPIALRSALLTPGRRFTMNASGSFRIPSARTDDPTRSGAVLTVSGESGSARFTLPRSGWRKLRTGGFQFSGKGCPSVTVTKRSISARCRGRTGSIELPESTLDVVLKLGRGTAKFCGQCGGTTLGDESEVFNRSNCAKASFCP